MVCYPCQEFTYILLQVRVNREYKGLVIGGSILFLTVIRDKRESVGLIIKRVD